MQLRSPACSWFMVWVTSSRLWSFTVEQTAPESFSVNNMAAGRFFGMCGYPSIWDFVCNKKFRTLRNWVQKRAYRKGLFKCWCRGLLLLWLWLHSFIAPSIQSCCIVFQDGIFYLTQISNEKRSAFVCYRGSSFLRADTGTSFCFLNGGILLVRRVLGSCVLPFGQYYISWEI